MQIWSPFPPWTRDTPDQPLPESLANPQADKADRARRVKNPALSINIRGNEYVIHQTRQDQRSP